MHIRRLLFCALTTGLFLIGLSGAAVDLRLNFFPWAHFELVGLARYQSLGPSTTDEASASLLMLQLHYYL